MKGQLRNPLFASILSALIPGTGQVYNQELLKGCIVLTLFMVLLGTVFGSIAVWLFSIGDAYIGAENINKGKKKILLHRNSSFAAFSSITVS